MNSKETGYSANASPPGRPESHYPVETVPEAILLLDASGDVVHADSSLATAALTPLRHRSLNSGLTVHAFLHPGCQACRLSEAWPALWTEFERTRLVEIEVKDSVLDAQLRLSLRSPVEVPGHNRNGDWCAMLAVKDISRCRTERQKLNAAQLLLAEENERGRIAIELHDGLCQMLSSIKYRVECLTTTPPFDAGQLAPVAAGLSRALEEVRRVTNNLAPTALEDVGLVEALHRLCKDFQAMHPGVSLVTEVDCTERELPRALCIAIYRMAQEALSNAGRHARARLVSLRLRCGATEGMHLCIEDNGRGFPNGRPAHRTGNRRLFGRRRKLGLSSMRHRVTSTGGELIIEAPPHGGTRLCAVWPRSVLELLVVVGEPVRDRVGGDGRDAV